MLKSMGSAFFVPCTPLTALAPEQSCRTVNTLPQKKQQQAKIRMSQKTPFCFHSEQQKNT